MKYYIEDKSVKELKIEKLSKDWSVDGYTLRYSYGTGSIHFELYDSKQEASMVLFERHLHLAGECIKQGMRELHNMNDLANKEFNKAAAILKDCLPSGIEM